MGDPTFLPDPTKTIAAQPSTGFTWPLIEDLRRLDLGLKEFMDLLEERLLMEALNQSGGVKNQAAELLGIKRTTLIEKLKKRNME